MSGKIHFQSDDLLALPPTELFDSLLRESLRDNASDLFVMSHDTHYEVRIRCLGTLKHLASLPREKGLHLVNVIKSFAGMDLAEKRRPADGRFRRELEGAPVDFRVNTVNTLYGEDCALRMSPRQLGVLPLEKLGLESDQLTDVSSMVNNSSGLLLVTGPTGSGKTTTLYSLLKHLNDGTRKINTLEDPIEYEVDGLRQSQVHSRIDLSFVELLRSVLRQAPDVIMVGEIRDPETADIAVRAANSGLLVMSTIHAPIAAGAIQSMLALNARPYFLANSLLGVLSQRLIRTLSPESRVGYDLSLSPETFSEVAHRLQPGEGTMIYGPMVNDPNSQGGYVGRVGLFEVLAVDRRVREMVAQGARTQALHQAAVEGGMLDFRQAALLKVARGETSIEEMCRVVPSDEIQELLM